MTAKNRRRFRISRDTILFTIGILGIIYETVIGAGDRPTLLILFAGMVGLPAFLKGDERVRKQEEITEAVEQPAAEEDDTT